MFTIGLSLYPTAINYMAGGVGSENYGAWQNWLVAFFTLAVVTALNHFGKGIWKLASILIGIIAGYIVSIPFGMVNLSSVGEAGMFQVPEFMHFGIEFEISSCVAIGLLFAINSVQAIGDYSATTIGAMNRTPKDGELQSGIVAYGLTNILSACFGCLPTATYSQNVGIVTTTKVINRCVLGLAAVILAVAGIVPKFSALLTTIPQCVLGGATVSVFASIAMTGMKLVASAEMDYLQFLDRRSCSSSGSRRFSGNGSAFYVSGMGYYNIRKISGSACNNNRCTAECDPSQKQGMRKKEEERKQKEVEEQLERDHKEFSE